MPKPLVATETIYAEALQLLDEQGSEALSARNLAAALGCSTRTLYQQVGKREDLIRKLLDYYFSSFTLDFQPEGSWQQCTKAWSLAMRQALLAHPNLSKLMTIENRDAISAYVNQLLKVLLRSGFSEEAALRNCRVLTHVVLGLIFTELETPSIAVRRKKRSRSEIAFEDLVIANSASRQQANTFQDTPEVFDHAVQCVIRGIEAELAS